MKARSPNHWTTREFPLLVVLICISLMISDVKHLFMNSLAISYLLKLFVEKYNKHNTVPSLFLHCLLPNFILDAACDEILPTIIGHLQLGVESPKPFAHTSQGQEACGGGSLPSFYFLVSPPFSSSRDLKPHVQD